MRIWEMGDGRLESSLAGRLVCLYGGKLGNPENHGVVLMGLWGCLSLGMCFASFGLVCLVG